MISAVPTAAAGVKVDLVRGGCVFVRRIKRTEMQKLMAAAELDPAKVATAHLFLGLVCRWAITAGEGITDEAGESVSVKRARGAGREAGLGEIACEEVFNALADDDVEKVRAAACDPLPEAAAGN